LPRIRWSLAGPVSNVHETRRRLLQKRLREVYRKVQDQQAERLLNGLLLDENTEMLMRLIGFALMLLERHAMDVKGRCLVPGCSLQRRVPWPKWQTCRIFVTAQFWVEQPLGIVQQAELG
jgi:hypothetical protein